MLRSLCNAFSGHLGPIAIAAAFALIARPGYADPTVTSLDVTTAPALAVGAESDESTVWIVPGGTTAQLIVVAVYSDGSEGDVTHHASTTYSPLTSTVVVTSAGGASFGAVGGEEPTGVVVTHGAVTKLVPFHVTP